MRVAGHRWSGAVWIFSVAMSLDLSSLAVLLAFGAFSSGYRVLLTCRTLALQHASGKRGCRIDLANKLRFHNYTEVGFAGLALIVDSPPNRAALLRDSRRRNV
jgi:hypothetical protein